MRLPAPRTPDPHDAPSLRWGILGAGGIAASMTTALLEGTGQRVAAVGSRDARRARSFADRFSIARSYGSYEDLVADDDVDVVYVATPHSEHHRHALLAIAADKPVLVEKAFTRNAAEAREVIAAADANAVTCVEAMWSVFLPGYDVVRRCVRDGMLGDLRLIVADQGQRLYPDGPPRLAAPELAGGALLDLGVYPLHLAAMLMPRIESVTATGTLTACGVDAEEVVTLRDDAGATAAISASMTARTPTTATVVGTDARLELAGPFYRPTTIRLIDPDGRCRATWAPEPGDTRTGLRYEAAEMARLVAQDRRESALLPWDRTVRVMELMDQVRARLGMVLPGE